MSLPTRYLILSALESGHDIVYAKAIPKEAWLAVECCVPVGLSEAQGGSKGVSPSFLQGNPGGTLQHPLQMGHCFSLWTPYVSGLLLEYYKRQFFQNCRRVEKAPP